MSVKALSAVFEDSQAKGSALLVLLALADWADHQGRCWPSYTQIAEKARVSRATAVAVIDDLIALGELARVSRGHAPMADGDDDDPASVRAQRRNQYQILLVKPSRKVVRPLDHLTRPQVVAGDDHLSESPVFPAEAPSDPVDRGGESGEKVVHDSDHLVDTDTPQVVQSARTGSPIHPPQVVQSADLHIRNRPSDRPSVVRPSGTAAAAAAVTTSDGETDAPIEALVEAWNQAVAEADPIPLVQGLTPARRHRIRTALAARPIEQWPALFARVAASTFCRGGGERGFVATFDWFLGTPEAALNAAEGVYDDHVSEAELHAARQQQARVGGCHHDPRCEDWRTCARAFALACRVRRSVPA